MKKALHRVWIQGASEMPEAYRENGKRWEDALGSEWELNLWDEEQARERWPEYAEVSDLCSHHAMRADLILARCLRDIGGIATGTDVRVNNVASMLEFFTASPNMVIVNPTVKSASNGLVWFAEPGHPFMNCLCRHQLRNRALLKDANVWRVTGPGCWYEAIAAHMWDLAMVTDRRAYTHSFRAKADWNPDAWVDPGYAASWL